jgi:hypothetical protein
MGKKFTKTIQRVETAKLNEIFSKDKSTTLEDLKMKLAIIEKEDPLADLKSKIVTSDNKDPLEELKKSLNMNISESNHVIVDEYFEELLDDEDDEKKTIEDIINIEKAEECNDIKLAEEEYDTETMKEDSKYKFFDNIANNFLIRTILMDKNDKLVIHIAMNNLEYDNYKKITENPFNVYHKDNMILNFYDFKKGSIVSLIFNIFIL